MDAVRCQKCGDVRWSFLGSVARKPCRMCGGRMVPERRHPHRGPETLETERRRRELPHPTEPAR